MPKSQWTLLIGFVKKETTTKSRLAAVAAGIRGSQKQNSATTWSPTLGWELKVLSERV
jgi:hypothetical protein